MIVYRICNVLTRILVGLFAHGHVIGLENVPLQGSLIVISNHIGWLDPSLIGASLPRPVRFMAKEELFKIPFVGWVVKNYGAFPVRRGESDRQAMHSALKILRAGEILGMFPEGHRSKIGQLQPGRSGAAVLAMKTGAQVLPIGITGTQNILRFPNVFSRPEYRVNIGRAFTLRPANADKEILPKDALAEGLEQMMHRIAELLPEEYRGVYNSKRYASKIS